MGLLIGRPSVRLQGQGPDPDAIFGVQCFHLGGHISRLKLTFGVQDFDPRLQSVECLETVAAVENCVRIVYSISARI